MPEYTPKIAKSNMETIIAGLNRKYDELSDILFRLDSPVDRAEINNLRTKLSLEIHHRELLAAFDEIAATIIRPPTEEEVNAFQVTLTELGRALDKEASIRATVGFIEDLMTNSAKRFIDIVETINTNNA